VSTRGHVAIGGGVGSLVRGALVLGALSVAGRGEVVAVLVLNVVGALALGWLVGRARHDPRWRRLLPLLGTGFLGALTTFSALAVQVGGALLDGAWLLAVGLGAFQLAVGLAAAIVGVRLGDRGADPGPGPDPGPEPDPGPADGEVAT
jgi:fluoride exporter